MECPYDTLWTVSDRFDELVDQQIEEMFAECDEEKKKNSDALSPWKKALIAKSRGAEGKARRTDPALSRGGRMVAEAVTRR